jgi:lipopolysaccharide export system protein LptA
MQNQLSFSVEIGYFWRHFTLCYHGMVMPLILVFLLFLADIQSLQALEDDQQQPLQIEADAVELDERELLSLYIGHVQVKQGTLELSADEVLVRHYPDRQPQRIIAIGQPATYEQIMDDQNKKVHGRALRMEYEADRDEIVLIDEAVLVQGKDRFSSDRIVYNRTSERVLAGTSAHGQKRVKIIIHPQNDQQSPP